MSSWDPRNRPNHAFFHGRLWCLWAGPLPFIVLVPQPQRSVLKASAENVFSLSPCLNESNPKPRKATQSQSQFSLICHPGDQPFALSFFLPFPFLFGSFYKDSEGVACWGKFTSLQESNHPPSQVLPLWMGHYFSAGMWIVHLLWRN